MKEENDKFSIADEILIDLFEQQALTYYCIPSPKLTGILTEDAMKKMSEFGDSLEEQEARKVYSKTFTKQVGIYINGVNSLLKNKMVEPDMDKTDYLYHLRLTKSGIEVARHLINKRREFDNASFLRRMSKQNVVLTSIIALATLLNVAVAVANFLVKPEQTPIEVRVNPTIQIDEVIAVPDSTVMKIELPQIEKEGS